MSMLEPSVAHFYPTVQRVIKELQPGQRQQILVPHSMGHSGKFQRDPYKLNDLHMRLNVSVSNPDIYAVLRLETANVIVDIAYFPK